MAELQIAGEEFIQCPIVSSSSDSCYHEPFVSNFHISGRVSYRSRPFIPRVPINALVYYEPPSRRQGISTRSATLSVAAIFVTFLGALYIVYKTFPQVTEEESEHFIVPFNLEQAKQLGLVLDRYKGDHYYHVMAGVCLFYIFLQTFAIPGSLFLSILSGYLFPFYVALILVCSCSMFGATMCFLLSQVLGRRIVLKYFPERASKWKMQVDKHRDNMFNYMVFLRITPLIPNWFINLSAPVIGVPLIPFALGTFIGVAPPSFFAIQGGQTLHTMSVENTGFDAKGLAWLGVLALVALIPVFLKNRLKSV